MARRLNRFIANLESRAGILEAECALGDCLEGYFGIHGNMASDETAFPSGSPELDRVHDLIVDGVDVNFSVQTLADEAGYSRFHLMRSFKKRYGQTLHDFQLDCRIKKAKLFLRQGKPISETAFTLGFSDQSHFQRHFKKRIALTPDQYQSFYAE
ncbi:MAG: hypothetical protein COB90_00735 [Hyphomicrobiales bacterium]|nr:MAG: hypothetical protein COB90_00735 [Hyphomicrobiales bacterium]